MKLLILGSGMYVTGRQNTGVGTVLASVMQASKEVPIDSVTVVARAADNAQVVADAAQRLDGMIGSGTSVSYRSLQDEGLADLLARERFHCAIVATPDHLHFSQISLLFDHGIHVLSVKPLVPTVEEHLALLTKQRERQLLGMVEFHKRYDEANLYTKKALADDLIGRPVHYDVHYSQRIGIPRTTFSDWVSHTNIFQYLGVHYIDLFYFMTGLKPVKAMAVGSYGVLQDEGIDTWDTMHATVVWRDCDGRESTSVLNIGWSDPDCSSAMSDQRYKLIGTKGRIENDHKHRGIEVLTDETATQHPNPYFSDFLLDADGEYVFQGYGYRCIRQFLVDATAVLTDKVRVADLEARRPSFSDTLIATSVIEAVNNSVSNNSQWESINAGL